MPWLRKARSTSPPRLTSSIPEMERHLAIMDSSGDTPNIEAIDSCPPAATSARAQDAEKTEAVLHDHETVPEPVFISSKAAGDDTSIPSAQHGNRPRSKKASTTQRKAQFSLPRLVSLSMCISYLLIQLVGLSLSFNLMNDYASYRLHHAESELQDVRNIISNKRFGIRLMDMRLARLQGTELQREYMESYDHCIARGLHTADEIFSGHDFTWNSSIRVPTMDWVSSNCDRLFYTPQLQYNSVLHRLTERIRRTAEDFFVVFKYRVSLLQRKYRNIAQQATANNFAADRRAKAKPGTPGTMEMPFGFTLECGESHRCRLAYHEDSYIICASDKVREDLILENAPGEIFRWSFPFKEVSLSATFLFAALYLLQACLWVCIVVALYLSCSRPKLQPGQSLKFAHIRRWTYSAIKNYFTTSHSMFNLFGFVLGSLSCVVAPQLTMHSNPQDDPTLFWMGLCMSVIHVILLVSFFPVYGHHSHLNIFCRSFAELAMVFRHKQARPLVSPGAQPESHIAKPVPKIGARHVSPVTPFTQDLRQAISEYKESLRAHNLRMAGTGYRELLRQSSERRETERVSGAKSDSDTDSDVSYVDLAGGATPFVSEERGGWAIVED
ncbi:DNA N-glycosylase and apurinic/apyrimidinic (AP) lyase [Curvularia kusanoi]|uniref:DNA N-glycosylase and apurinic/apyrimidinic (AP) lyase n=1 Tax=Curvularia kusanoi TaxID=90978 RepID=A0A9P4TMV1_CURKU|nr:DNA N-glycosylase and apurinic/apyrimidinic (AP) lyase [Curvularia kusanoi]